MVAAQHKYGRGLTVLVCVYRGEGGKEKGPARAETLIVLSVGSASGSKGFGAFC